MEYTQAPIQQMPQAIPQPAPAPVPIQTQYAPPPDTTIMADGGGVGKSITNELWIGFMFAFLAGLGLGFIYTQNQKNKFPKLI